MDALDYMYIFDISWMSIEASMTIYYMADWFRVLWLVNSRPVSSRTDLKLSITFSKPE